MKSDRQEHVICAHLSFARDPKQKVNTFFHFYRGAVAPRTPHPAHLGNIQPGEKILYGLYGPLLSGIQLKYGPYDPYMRYIAENYGSCGPYLSSIPKNNGPSGPLNIFSPGGIFPR